MKERKRTAIINALTKAGWGDVVMTDWEYEVTSRITGRRGAGAKA